MIKAVTDSLLSLIYPQHCRICRNGVESSDDGVACSDCWSKTRIFDGNETLCKKCGAYLSIGPSAAETFCRNCDEHFYDRAYAVGIYENALAAAVLHLKTTPHISGKLKRLLLNALPENEGSSVVIPVPLSRKRMLERGFNQAAVLSRIVCGRDGFDLDEYSLIRKIHTPIHRAAMDKKARELTVRNAFKVVRPNLVKGRNILLVDDIFTSGATASNCARVLKTSGALKVTVFTIARAV